MKDVSTLGSILGIWAHPDDEAWSMSGLARHAICNGQKVYIVTATRGEKGNVDGHDNTEGMNLAIVREQEMRDSLDCIGDIAHQWLEYHDGELKQADSNMLVSDLQDAIARYKPDSIITFEPNGITGHDDHRAISLATKQAVSRSQYKPQLYYAVETREHYDKIGRTLDEKFNIYFNTDMPTLIAEGDATILMRLNSDELERKMRCLAAHRSQMSHILSDSEVADMIRTLASTEAFIRAEEFDKNE